MRSMKLLSVLVCALLVTGCARTLDTQPIGTAQPVAQLQDDFSAINQDGRIYFAGVPTREGIDKLAAQGVTVIVNLRTPEAMAADEQPFDEEAYAKSKGIEYIYIPTTPDSFDADTVDTFADVLSSTKGKALVHCNSSNTAGGLWAGYLVREKGLTVDEAIDKGKAAGLSRDSMIEAVRRVAGEDAEDDG